MLADPHPLLRDDSTSYDEPSDANGPVAGPVGAPRVGTSASFIKRRKRPWSASRFLFLLLRPMCWSRSLRRLFLVTLPLAILVWVALFGGGVAALIVSTAAGAIRTFWNAPRRRRYQAYQGYY